MKTALIGLFLLAGLASAAAQPFPAALPPNTVVGRLVVSAGQAQAIPFARFLAANGLRAGKQCVTMWPSSAQTASVAWNLVDAFGTAISTVGTTSQGLQEAINYAVNNGQCLRVYGRSSSIVSTQTGTLSSGSPI